MFLNFEISFARDGGARSSFDSGQSNACQWSDDSPGVPERFSETISGQMKSTVRQFWLKLTTSFWISSSFLTNKFCARSSFCLKPRPINLSEIHRGIISVANQTFLFRLILWSYGCFVAWSGTVYLLSLVFHNVNSLYNFVTLETRKSSSKLIRTENKNVWLAINYYSPQISQ